MGRCILWEPSDMAKEGMTSPRDSHADVLFAKKEFYFMTYLFHNICSLDEAKGFLHGADDSLKHWYLDWFHHADPTSLDITVSGVRNDDNITGVRVTTTEQKLLSFKCNIKTYLLKTTFKLFNVFFYGHLAS